MLTYARLSALARAIAQALACIATSPFEFQSWGVVSLTFTVDDAKTWQIREVVHRTARELYTKQQLTPVFVTADKAFIAAAHWDLHGYPTTRTAALREVEY